LLRDASLRSAHNVIKLGIDFLQAGGPAQFIWHLQEVEDVVVVVNYLVVLENYESFGETPEEVVHTLDGLAIIINAEEHEPVALGVLI